jgi:hypothetical protein
LILFLVVITTEFVFYRSVYANPEILDRTPTAPANAKLAAVISMLLWTSIACCGRGIGYIEPPLDKIHAEIHVVYDSALAALRDPHYLKGQDHQDVASAN